MRADAERQYSECDVLSLRLDTDVAELLGHDLGTPDRAAQDRLVENDGKTYGRVAVENSLP
ncbi:hypothetical protein NE235_06435 [Actinoallomurus spadix]|uniref:Uncharacterized protein n=1 Tax=Actinoallomurus spadix TaxID=79912 RepID=A0ABN0VV15_9ACTN|nr:hypothetical protein [Actinoallomurus spadix]MCO5985744.1 hypothetical protein [Actinoallomurus spadix]